MPQAAKWGLIAATTIVCGGAAYLMVIRGPALLIDLGNALAACF